MYYLLSGQTYPFKHQKVSNDQEMYYMLMQQDLQFGEDLWNTYENGENIKQVLRGLLIKHPEKRLSAKKALRNDLFKVAKSEMRRAHSESLKSNLQFTMPSSKKKRTNVIKRGMLIFISTRLLPEARYLELTQLFKMMDTNSEGYLRQEQLGKLLIDCGGIGGGSGEEGESHLEDQKALKELNQMFSQYSNSDGRMTYSDFISSIIDLKGEVTKDIIQKCFLMISSNQTNSNNQPYITRQ